MRQHSFSDSATGVLWQQKIRDFRIWYCGVGVAFLFLFAACIAATSVDQQFSEMDIHTGILDRGAKRARGPQQK
jgi:hypothetical protein